MSDQKEEQICRFCQRNKKVLFYCEDCGLACCSDCLRDDLVDFQVCKDCNSKNIRNNEINGNKQCNDCKSENISRVSQHFKSCPKCHSNKILNIYEKKEELEQRFLELVKLTRSFIKPLKEIIDKLSSIRFKIKNARDPPIRCYHYPKMESELLAIFKAGIELKNDLFEKINMHFNQLTLNKEYFFDIYNQPNSNVRIIESILETLHRSHDSINNYLTTNFEKVGPIFKTFQKNLEFISKINKKFFQYKQFLNLAKNEKPVFAIKTKLTGMGAQKRLKKSTGILFITNLDLSFIHEYGLIKKKQELLLKAPIDDLTNLKDTGKIFKKLFIQFDYGKYEFSLPANIISKIIDYIVLAHTFQDKDIFDYESAKQLQKMDFKLNELINFIEEKINSFFNIKCHYNQIIIDEQKEEQEKQYNKFLNKACCEKLLRESPYSDYQSPEQYTPQQNVNRPPENPYYRDHDYSPCEDYDPYTPPNVSQNNYMFQYPPHYSQHPNRPPNYDHMPHINERNDPMRRLRRFPTNRQNYPTHPPIFRTNRFNRIPIYSDFKPIFENNPNISFNDFHKNHLSDFFNSDDPYLYKNHNVLRNIFEFNRNIYRKMMEVKRERYSLIETLKKLDVKFDQGRISEVDYFKTFKNLQKELYLIDKKIQDITEKANDEKFIRDKLEGRNFI